MKTLCILLLTAASVRAQATATFQFAGEPLGFVTTVQPDAYPTEINGIESLLTPGCSGITLASGVTSASTTFSLANVPSGCTIKPGMGLMFGCAATGGNCTMAAAVKLAGCTSNVCTIAQPILGTTAGTYASGTAVTVTKYSTGGSLSCALQPIYQALAQVGAVSVTPPSNAALASTAIATANASILTLLATINNAINNDFTCLPNQ